MSGEGVRTDSIHCRMLQYLMPSLAAVLRVSSDGAVVELATDPKGRLPALSSVKEKDGYGLTPACF